MLSDHSPPPRSQSDSLQEQTSTKEISELTLLSSGLNSCLSSLTYQKTILRGNGMREIFGVMELPCILIVLVGTGIYTCVNIHRNGYLPSPCSFIV